MSNNVEKQLYSQNEMSNPIILKNRCILLLLMHSSCPHASPLTGGWLSAPHSILDQRILTIP